MRHPIDRTVWRIVPAVIALASASPAIADTVQLAYVKASNTDANDHFGYACSVSGESFVIGAPREASSATGIDGNSSLDVLPNAGAAYVYARNGANWTQQAYLKASNTDVMDFFGWSVAMDGDTIVVGAPGEDSDSTGVNGSQENAGSAEAGAVYVFVRNGPTWVQQAYLKASNTGAGDRFGSWVSISGDTIVVGAWAEDSASVGVNGDQASDSSIGAGAAYVFVRHGTTWSQQAYLKASNTDPGDAFGRCVEVSGNTIVVGAYAEDGGGVSSLADQASDAKLDSGAAYVFERDGGTWTQQAYLKAPNSDPSDYFGLAVAIDGDTIAVGAYGEDSTTNVVDGLGLQNLGNAHGAAYVFNRSGQSWTQQAYLKALNCGDSDQFGHAISVSGDLVVVGAYREDSKNGGIGADPFDDGLIGAGAAYAFRRDGSKWAAHEYLKPSNPGESDHFAWMFDLEHDTLVAGAFQESSNSTGVNGDESSNLASNAGAAYVYDLALGKWDDLGLGKPGIYGQARLVGEGDLELGSSGTLDIANAPIADIGVLLTSTSSSPIAFLGGTLAAYPFVLALPFVTDAAGAVNHGWAQWPSVAGTDLYFQAILRDGSASNGVALTNAIVAHVP